MQRHRNTGGNLNVYGRTSQVLYPSGPLGHLLGFISTLVNSYSARTN